jgi:hypothetical protein
LNASGAIVSITIVSSAPAANACVKATAVGESASYNANPIRPNTADTTTTASQRSMIVRVASPA